MRYHRPLSNTPTEDKLARKKQVGQRKLNRFHFPSLKVEMASHSQGRRIEFATPSSVWRFPAPPISPRGTSSPSHCWFRSVAPAVRCTRIFDLNALERVERACCLLRDVALQRVSPRCSRSFATYLLPFRPEWRVSFVRARPAS